jgi:hypothetical protein
MKTRHYHRCQAQVCEGAERCDSLRPAWICTANNSVERRCDACHHESSCCRLVADIVGAAAR